MIVRDNLQDQTVASGVSVTACKPGGANCESKIIGWNSRLLTERDVLAFPEGCAVKFGQSTIMTPLAKDMLKRRRVEIRREGDGGL